MKGNLFKSWFGKFLNLLEEPSVIVLDNARYHSTLMEKEPTSSSTKKEIIDWINSKKIVFSPNETRAELYEVVKRSKSWKKLYEIDIMAFNAGHEVVRLPPYHYQYNPIELIWAKVKGEVAEKNNTFNMEDVEKLAHNALNNCTKEDWEARVRHAENLQEEDFQKLHVSDIKMEPFIINLENDSSSDEDIDLDDDIDLDEIQDEF